MLDPLDILTNIDDVIPYYQAIFNAEEQRVVGYEVLGRILADAEIESLGPFFLDSGIPEEYKLRSMTESSGRRWSGLKKLIAIC